MKERLRRLARRYLSPATRRLIRAGVGRVRYEVASTLAFTRGIEARPAMRTAFARFEPTFGSRSQSVLQTASDATLLRRLAASKQDAVLFDAILTAASRAERIFRPAELQSYVDVSVRVAAIRAFAEYIGDADTLTAALIEHAPNDRAPLLARAELLLDRSRADEATPLIRHALRMQAVCQTAQQLLARAVPGVDYDLSEYFCPMPFTHFSTSFKADAFACCCSAWVPYPIGNVIDAPSADAVWNSETAVEIRRSIHDGDFRYCSRTLCSYIAARTLPRKDSITDPVLRRYIDERTVVIEESPVMVQLNHDQSCNLACPSCRTGIVTAGPEEQKVYVDAAERVLVPLLRNVDGMTYISGGGEAFASAHYRKILGALNRREFPGLFVFLISNGLLLNAKRWAEFPDLPEMIGNLSISIDAARAETYERLRRPGKWHVLMENLELISRMRAAGRIRRLQINFVVQADNFRELPEFIALGNRLGVDSYWLQRLTNYGAYDEPVFAAKDVTAALHPDHGELLAILREPFMDDPRVDFDMIRPVLPEFVGSGQANARLRRRMRPEMVGLEAGTIVAAF